MRYSYGDEVCLEVQPQEWDKDCGKEVLKYAVGSLLYMPASNSAIAKKIISGQYWFVKSLVLDLEDALGDDMVGFGQRSICATMNELADAIKKGEGFGVNNLPMIFIRVRNFGQMKESLLILGDNIQYITGFNIPKFDKENCGAYIDEFEEVAERVKQEYNVRLYMMPIIENKSAIYRQRRMDNLLTINDKLRRINDNVLNIRVGGADFCSVYGIRRSIHDDIYDIGVVRSVLNDIINVFGKNYVVSGPVWEYFENRNHPEDRRWRTGLENELYADRLNGFIGKTCIHPSQCLVIQQSLIVNKSDYEDAMNIIGMNVNTTGVIKSVGGNRMNEVKTHTNWALKTLALARVYGVKADEVM